MPKPNSTALTSMHNVLRLALAEERGLLIVALYEMTSTDLEKLVEAAQLIDSEGVQVLDGQGIA